MSSHVLSRLVISCHVMSRLVLSCHVMSCHVMSCHVISRLLTSCHIMSCHVTSCQLMSCHVISRVLTSCYIMSCHVTSCHVMSSCPRSLLPNLSFEPSKFFYYGGGVATTRFSKPWPCAGIRLGATLSLWRRVHCERARVAPWAFLTRSRGRLRGSGVLEVCRGCAAALCRGDWVPGAFCKRMANVRFAWQRGSCVLGGVPACRGRAGGALPWGDWVPGVSHTRMILRAATCVSRGRCGTSDAIDALGKALDGGSAWQAQ